MRTTGGESPSSTKSSRSWFFLRSSLCKDVDVYSPSSKSAASPSSWSSVSQRARSSFGSLGRSSRRQDEAVLKSPVPHKKKPSRSSGSSSNIPRVPRSNSELQNYQEEEADRRRPKPPPVSGEEKSGATAARRYDLALARRTNSLGFLDGVSLRSISNLSSVSRSNSQLQSEYREPEGHRPNPPPVTSDKKLLATAPGKYTLTGQASSRGFFEKVGSDSRSSSNLSSRFRSTSHQSQSRDREAETPHQKPPPVTSDKKLLATAAGAYEVINQASSRGFSEGISSRSSSNLSSTVRSNPHQLQTSYRESERQRPKPPPVTSDNQAHATAAGGYALALAHRANSTGYFNEVSKDMETLSQLVQNEELYEFLVSPQIIESKKMSILRTVADEVQLHKYTSTFLEALVEKRRMHLVKDVLREFEKIHNDLTGTQVATVTSAVKLETSELELVAKKIKSLSGATNVRVTNFVDPSLIAGYVIKFDKGGSKHIDMSVKGQLDRLASQFDYPE